MTNKIFDNKVAVVTGGRSGIGASMCERFLHQGARVISLDLYEKVDQGLNNQNAISQIPCDVSDETSILRAFTDIKNHFLRIDLLCINAGIVPSWARYSETTKKTWDDVMSINVIGAALTLKHAIDSLVKPGSSVLFTGSINSFKGDGNIAPYVASKHAVLGIIKSAAIDLGKDGIRVNGIAPGPIATEALVERIKTRTGGDNQAFEIAIEGLKSLTALKRMATVTEVVNLAEFLLSDAASGITGQLVTVDCGIL